MSNRLGGFQGTSYLGTNANQPPNVTFHTDEPNQYDTQNYSIGDIWIDTLGKTVWCLVSLAGDSTSKGQLATWISLGGGGGGNTNYVTDAGTATESGGDINIFGGTNINTAGSSNTVTVNLDQNLVGLGSVEMDDLVANTSAEFPFLTEGVVYANSSGQLTISNGNDGEVLIGSTAGVPLWRNLTAGSNVSIVNGSNSIEISATGGGGGSETSSSIIGTSATSISFEGAITYCAPFDSIGGAAHFSISRAQYPVPQAGIIDKLYVHMQENTSSTPLTVTFNKNGVNSTLVATIPSLTTGEFTDLVHTVSVAAGDLITFEVSAGSVSSTSFGSIGVRFTPLSGGGSAGSMVLLATKTATAQPDLEFESEISPAYNNYLIVYDEAEWGPTANPIDYMMIQLSIDNGATYITSGYLDASSVAQTGMPVMIKSGAAVSTIGNGTIWLYNLTSGSGFPSFGGPATLSFNSPSMLVTSQASQGLYPNATDVNAIRIVITDGSDFSGTFSLYGIIS